MASVLDLERYGADLQRQLLRRIGYTNGLHKIRRFPRVVEYLYSVMPTSVLMLAQILIREENLRAEQQRASDRPLKGRKYAQGIVDVAQALLLIEKFGPKVALSSQGYACHALVQTSDEPTLDAFLFHKVIEADGEYTLNILRLVSEGVTDVVGVGRELTERFIALIQFKAKWVTEGVADRLSQRTLSTLLSDAERVFRKATDRNGAEADFFLKHTVAPRLEWLVDLGCLQHGETGVSGVTVSGERVLKALRGWGFWHENFVWLPLDAWLASQLSLRNVSTEPPPEDFAWRLVAAAQAGAPAQEPPPPSAELLQFLRSVYGCVKLANFNEADALSVYEVIATHSARRGRVVLQREFEEALGRLVREYPGEIFKLSKRRGRGLYIALKKSP